MYVKGHLFLSVFFLFYSPPFNAGLLGNEWMSAHSKDVRKNDSMKEFIETFKVIQHVDRKYLYLITVLGQCGTVEQLCDLKCN